MGISAQPTRKSSVFAPVEFDEPEVSARIPVAARRLLAVGRWFAAQNVSKKQPEFHALKSKMAIWASVPESELRPLLALLTRLGLHEYIGRRRRYVTYTQGKVAKLVYRLVPIRLWAPLEADPTTGLIKTPNGLLARLRADPTQNHGGRRAGAGRPRRGPKPAPSIQVDPTSQKFQPVKPSVLFENLGDARARARISTMTRPGPSSMAPVIPLPVVPDRVSRIRPRARVFGIDRLARAQALGNRLLPPVPDAALVPSVTVPAPALLPGGSPEDDVQFLVTAYRAARDLRFRNLGVFELTLRSMKPRDFARLVEAAKLMRAAGIPPAAWVLFSFDVWREYAPARRPPPFSFVFSAKRLAERFEWFDRMRDAYVIGRSYLVPEHRALVEDHQAMMRELLCSPLASRADVLAVVERYFPGDSWERRVAGAKQAVQRTQQAVHASIASGGLGW